MTADVDSIGVVCLTADYFFGLAGLCDGFDVTVEAGIFGHFACTLENIVGVLLGCFKRIVGRLHDCTVPCTTLQSVRVDERQVGIRVLLDSVRERFLCLFRTVDWDDDVFGRACVRYWFTLSCEIIAMKAYDEGAEMAPSPTN
jgi:hypothetical protein